MSTLHLVIICVVGLAGLRIVTRAVAGHHAAGSEASKQTCQVLAAVVGAVDQMTARTRELTAAVAGVHGAVSDSVGDVIHGLHAATAELADVTAGLTPGPSRHGQTVTVNTRRPDDQTLRGVVLAEHADRVILGDAAVVTGGGLQPVPGGVLSVPTANVAWTQETP